MVAQLEGAIQRNEGMMNQRKEKKAQRNAVRVSLIRGVVYSDKVL